MTASFDPGELIADAMLVGKESVMLRGVEVPKDFQVRLTHPGWPVPMTMTIVVDPERGPIPAGLSNYRHGTASDVTDVPTYRQLDVILSATGGVVDEILQRMTAQAAGLFYRNRVEEEIIAQHTNDDDYYRSDEYDLDTARIREASIAVAAAAVHATKPRRRRIVSQRHLAEVAAAYREAMAQGIAPTQHVAERFNASHSTASRWVGMAREAGELGPATGPKPGEAKQ